MNESYAANTLIHMRANWTVNITARVTNNGDLKSVQISLNTSADFVPMAKATEEFGYQYEMPATSLSTSNGLMFYIDAVDEAGNQVVFHPNVAIPVSP